MNYQLSIMLHQSSCFYYKSVVIISLMFNKVLNGILFGMAETK